MKPFLYVDNWGRAQPRNRLEELLAAENWPVERIDARNRPMPESTDYSGVFVGPGDAAVYDDDRWIADEGRFLASVIAAGVPILGLCFGTQILAHTLFGPEAVGQRDARESGFGMIALTPEAADDPLTRGLPARMEVFHWHGDEVFRHHPEMIVLADGPGCGNQIWRWRQGPVWGVQPHPEYDGDGLRGWLEADRAHFERAGVSAADVADRPDRCAAAGTMFDAFLVVVRNQAAERQAAEMQAAGTVRR